MLRLAPIVARATSRHITGSMNAPTKRRITIGRISGCDDRKGVRRVLSSTAALSPAQMPCRSCAKSAVSAHSPLNCGAGAKASSTRAKPWPKHGVCHAGASSARATASTGIACHRRAPSPNSSFTNAVCNGASADSVALTVRIAADEFVSSSQFRCRSATASSTWTRADAAGA